MILILALYVLSFYVHEVRSRRYDVGRDCVFLLPASYFLFLTSFSYSQYNPLPKRMLHCGAGMGIPIRYYRRLINLLFVWTIQFLYADLAYFSLCMHMK